MSLIRKIWRTFLGEERFHLDPQYFPESTRKLFPTAMILKYGALPLGLKAGRILNIGLLNSRDEVALEILEKAARAELTAMEKIHTYHIDPGEFLNILRSIYHVDETALKRCQPGDLSPHLRQFLGPTQK